MKLLLVAGLVLLQTMRLDPSDAVKTAINEFAEAYVEADVEALDALLADPYMHVNGGSGTVVGRDEWLAWVGTQREALDAGTLSIDRYEITDLTIRMRGDTAHVTGIVRSSGVRDRVPFFSDLRFTHVWVKEGDLWKRAMFHDSLLPGC